MTSYGAKTMEYREVLGAIASYGVRRVNVKSGDKIAFGTLKGQVLSADKKADDSNSSSIVIFLKHGKKSFLFTGDAPAKLENKLKTKYNVNADVLKVSHHGSNYSSAISFIKEVSPEISVISVGSNNDYGHPNKNVLNRLKKYSDNIYRTDKDGTVIVTSTGTKLSVNKKATEEMDSDNNNNATDQNNVTSGNIIGNKNSKVYHVTSCTRLPLEKNRVYFKNKSAAIDAGFHPCSYCCK